MSLLLLLGSASSPAQIAGGVRLYAVEDFETGSASLFPWNQITQSYYTTYYPRGVVTDAAHSGKYSLGINSTGYSGCGYYFSIEFPVSGEISFFVKVASTPSGSPLIFYIDNQENGRFFGNFGWVQVTYPVSAGSHTFKWIASGTYNAWIDDIELRAP